jgi:hypothetical protein
MNDRGMLTQGIIGNPEHIDSNCVSLKTHLPSNVRLQALLIVLQICTAHRYSVHGIRGAGLAVVAWANNLMYELVPHGYSKSCVTRSDALRSGTTVRGSILST